MIARVSSSLRVRTLLAVVGVVVLTAAGVGAGVSISARSWIYQDAQERQLDRFEQEMNGAERDARAPGPPGTPRSGDQFPRFPWDAAIVAGGRVITDPKSITADLPGDLRTEVEASPGVYRFARISGGRVAIGYQPPAVPGEGHVSVLVVRSLGEVPARLRHLTWLVAASVLVAACIGVMAGLVLMRTVLRPLRAVTDTAARVAAGDDGARMPGTEVAELRDLTATFNDMLEKREESLAVLREQEERSRRFVADVSHELRSSLAALVPAAELLAEELDDDPGVPGRAARLVQSEVTGLTALVDDLLEMTRRDAGDAEIRAEPVDAAALVAEALRARGWHEVAVRPADGVVFTSDPRRITAVVANLVGNALRHGAAPVEVELRTAPEVVTVTVIDRGIGIAPEHVPHVFDRMYKASGARTRSGGAGLGLAIARENARLLGGDVVYRRERNRTLFVATFTPLATQ